MSRKNCYKQIVRDVDLVLMILDDLYNDTVAGFMVKYPSVKGKLEELEQKLGDLRRHLELHNQEVIQPAVQKDEVLPRTCAVSTDGSKLSLIDYMGRVFLNMIQNPQRTKGAAFNVEGGNLVEDMDLSMTPTELEIVTGHSYQMSLLSDGSVNYRLTKTHGDDDVNSVAKRVHQFLVRELKLLRTNSVIHYRFGSNLVKDHMLATKIRGIGIEYDGIVDGAYCFRVAKLPGFEIPNEMA